MTEALNKDHLMVNSDEISEETNRKINFLIYIVVIVTTVTSVLIVYLFNPKKVPVDQQQTFNIIFINDIHLDNKYNSHSLASENTACRTFSSNSTIGRPYGQYLCDLPEVTFQSMVNFLPTVENSPSFIVLGGDNIAHGLSPTKQEVQNVTSHIINTISAKYPNTPIHFVLGNNDFVLNYGDWSSDLDDFSNIASTLQNHLTSSENESFRAGGYYFHDYPSMNLRFLFLNTIIYSHRRQFNSSRTDPYSQFQFIRTKSEEAYHNGMKIGVFVHIPPGVSYWDLSQGFHSYYAEQFYNVLSECNISFIVAGHTHLDILMPIYDSLSKPMYSLSSPSLSPGHANNPSFRVLKMRNGNLIDYDQYYADIMMNPQTELKWELEYSFRNTYHQNDVQTSSLLSAIEYIQTTGEGRWKYRERIHSRAEEKNSFFYCILNCSSSEAVEKCLQGLNPNSISPYSNREIL